MRQGKLSPAPSKHGERERRLLDFQSSYQAGADLGGWDRAELELDYPAPAPLVEEPAPAFPRHNEES